MDFQMLFCYNFLAKIAEMLLQGYPVPSLLNCYPKLKYTSKLDSFIKAPGELKFDLETAIAM